MKSDGLKVFPVTANQRVLLGEDIFLETHCPIQLLRRSNEQISERELLQQLQNTIGLPPGNRVFVLIGAAGSGKSELMAWLERSNKHHPQKFTDAFMDGIEDIIVLPIQVTPV